eukprot:3974021-Pleurochrysis_carterae.AAC.1
MVRNRLEGGGWRSVAYGHKCPALKVDAMEHVHGGRASRPSEGEALAYERGARKQCVHDCYV